MFNKFKEIHASINDSSPEELNGYAVEFIDRIIKDVEEIKTTFKVITKDGTLYALIPILVFVPNNQDSDDLTFIRVTYEPRIFVAVDTKGAKNQPIIAKAFQQIWDAYLEPNCKVLYSQKLTGKEYVYNYYKILKQNTFRYQLKKWYNKWFRSK